METFIASQEKLAHKIKNTHSNLKKQGKPKISIGIIDSNLENIKESWTRFQNNDMEIQKIKTDNDKELPYFIDEFFDATEDSYVEVRGLLQEHKNSLLYLRPAVSASTNASDGNISNLPSASWHHIDGEINPAELPNLHHHIYGGMVLNFEGESKYSF